MCFLGVTSMELFLTCLFMKSVIVLFFYYFVLGIVEQELVKNSNTDVLVIVLKKLTYYTQ